MKEYGINDLGQLYFQRNQKLITHPDNYNKLKAQLKNTQYPERDVFIPYVVEIITNQFIPKDRETERIVNPDGTISERNGYRFSLDRFTIVEEQDISWLLYCGYIKPEREMVMYLVTDTNFRTNDIWYQNNATVLSPTSYRLDEHIKKN